jgi:hypothetical protein
VQIFQRQTFVYLCVGSKCRFLMGGGGGGGFFVCVWQGVGVEASKGTGLYVWESADFPGGRP